MTTPEVPTTSGIATALHRITAVLPDSNALAQALQDMAGVIVEYVPDLAGSGITLMRGGDGSWTTVASSSALVRLIDEAQYAEDDGPCLTALRTGRVVTVEDLDEEQRWPQFTAAAREHKVRSVNSEPLLIGGKSVGALNNYGLQPGAFDPAMKATLAVFARQIEIVMASLLQRFEQARLTAELTEALTSRAVIDQAIGVIVAREQCTPQQAFETLRRMSNRSNVVLRDIATRLVAAAGPDDPASDGRAPEGAAGDADLAGG